MNKSFLQIKSLKKKFIDSTDEIVVLDDINLDLTTNKLVALTGPSGSGKSTFIHLLGLLDIPDRGEYNLDTSKNLFNLSDKEKSDYRRRNISIVFQNFNLISDLTALENVMLPNLYTGESKSKSLELAKNLLTKAGLENRLNHTPKELSGGEQQRVAIARSLINKPKLILADEPTGSLDMETAKDVFELLNKQKKPDRLIIFATHNRFFANKADCLLEMIDGNIKSSNV